MGLPEAPQAVYIGLRNCYVARFEHPLKASKASQQLSKAFEPQNPLQQLAKASLRFTMGPPEAPQAVYIGLRNCYVARFEHPLKASKASQQLSKAFQPQNPLQLQNPLQQLAKASLRFTMGPPKAPQAVYIGLGNCYVARFEHPLKASKASQKLSKAFEPQNPLQQLAKASLRFPMEPPKAPQAVYIGLRNCYVARFEHPLKASKASQQLSKAFEPQNPLQQLAKASLRFPMEPPKAPQAVYIGLRNCYVARFEHPFKESKASQQLSKAFDPQNPLQQLAKASLRFPMEPPKAPQAVYIGLRNCYVARFEHPLKESKASQQLAKAFDPQNPLQQLAKASLRFTKGPPKA